MEIRFLGHAAFELTDGDTTVLIDPFLTGNPKAAATADEVSADAILLTHGHVDHMGATAEIRHLLVRGGEAKSGLGGAGRYADHVRRIGVQRDRDTRDAAEAQSGAVASQRRR